MLHTADCMLSCRLRGCPAQDLYTRVVRQRDLFRKLLQDSAGDPAGAAAAAAAAGAIILRSESISTPPRVEVRDFSTNCLSIKQGCTSLHLAESALWQHSWVL